jgi:hypothetical protein
MGWAAMQSTDSTMVASKMVNLSSVPLADLPDLSTVTLDEALGRLGLDPRTAPAPVPFASAI